MLDRLIHGLVGGLGGADALRRRLYARAPEGPLRDYLAGPFPDPAMECRRIRYVAMDMETTGLNPARDAILSIGWVEMQGTEIQLATARHRILRADRPLTEESIVIHGLTHDQIAAGDPPEQVIAEVLAILTGRVLIAHHARIEFQFLKNACARLFGGEFLCPVIDTQTIAYRALERKNQPISPNALRLFNLRQGYNLPRYNAHNALSDALCAAELFAAQVAERDAGDPLPLKGFLGRA